MSNPSEPIPAIEAHEAMGKVVILLHKELIAALACNNSLLADEIERLELKAEKLRNRVKRVALAAHGTIRATNVPQKAKNRPSHAY